MDPSASDDPLELLSELARSERSALAAAARAEGVSAEDAVECVQEALCTLLVMTRKQDAPTESESPALLSGIVRSLAKNRRRRHFRARPHQEIEQLGLLDPVADSADELIARAEEHVRLRACVEDLCEIQKAVVTLRLLEEHGVTPSRQDRSARVHAGLSVRARRSKRWSAR